MFGSEPDLNFIPWGEKKPNTIKCYNLAILIILQATFLMVVRGYMHFTVL